MQGESESGERSVVISLQDEERKYLSGHVIDGRNLFPAMGYLVSCRIHYHTNVVMGFACIM
jgi:fatty acid synthase